MSADLDSATQKVQIDRRFTSLSMIEPENKSDYLLKSEQTKFTNSDVAYKQLLKTIESKLLKQDKNKNNAYLDPLGAAQAYRNKNAMQSPQPNKIGSLTERRQQEKGWQLKPTTVNYFTGQQLKEKEKPLEKMNAHRELLKALEVVELKYSPLKTIPV